MGIYKLKLKGGISMSCSSPLWATVTDLDMQVTVTTLMYLLTPDSYTVLLLTGPQSCNGFPRGWGLKQSGGKGCSAVS